MIRRWAPRLILALPWLVAAAILWYVWPRTPRAPSAGSIVVAPYPVAVTWGFRALAAAWCVSAVFLLYQLAIRRHLAWSLAAGMTVLLVPPAGGTIFMGHGLTGWTDVSHLRASTGTMYHAQHQWESDALTEELGRGPLFLRTKVIGVNDNERGNYALVRPSGVKQYDLVVASSPGHPDWGPLAQSRDGRWLVYLCAFQAYPTPKKGCSTSLVYDQGRNVFYGDQDLREVSPFLLIEPGDRLSAGDLHALLYARGTGLEYVHADTDVRVLDRESTSRNREVRMAVARMLAQTDPSDDNEVPLAMHALERMSREDTDPAVRQAAGEAADRFRGLVERTREDRLR